MRIRIAMRCILLCSALFFWSDYAPAGPDALASPLVSVAGEYYEFPPVIEGLKVRHDFSVRNTGTSPLELREVKPDCGCTMVSYKKEIPAHGEGAIAICLNTSGYGRQHVVKEIFVKTNDEKRPSFKLIIEGEVKPAADISPAEAMLTGNAGQHIKQVLTIVPIRENPMKILEVKAEKGKDFRYKIIEAKQSGSTKYRLTIYNKKQEKGWYMDTIYLKTSSKMTPVIKIPVLGYIRSRT